MDLTNIKKYIGNNKGVHITHVLLKALGNAGLKSNSIGKFQFGNFIPSNNMKMTYLLNCKDNHFDYIVLSDLQSLTIKEIKE